MADAKKVRVTVKAIGLGFKYGRRIRPGEVFSMNVPVADDGSVKLPKWVIRAEDPMPEKPGPGLRPPGSKVPERVSGIFQDDAADLI